MSAPPINYPASERQIKLIRTLKTKLGLDEETYRAALQECGVASSLDLKWPEADALIKMWVKQAKEMGVWVDMNRAPSSPARAADKALKFDALGKRAGNLATPEQLRKIDALWSHISRRPTEAERDAALNEFLHNRFGVSSIEFVGRGKVPAILRALDAMLAQKITKKTAATEA